MPDFAAPVERLIDELKHLPGIGQKTAQRLAFHLLRAAPEDALALADAIRDAKEKIRACSVCHNITDSDPCLYCVGPRRSHGGLSFEVVEAAGCARHADRRRNSGGRGPGVCRRSDHVEGHGRTTGFVGFIARRALKNAPSTLRKGRLSLRGQWAGSIKTSSTSRTL